LKDFSIAFLGGNIKIN